MPKVKYGIIGCGSHALRSHALSTKGSEYLTLVAVHDISAGNMERFEIDYEEGLVKYPHESDLLASDVEAVLIATPDQFHAETMKNALTAGKHVFIEKPMVTSEEHFELLVKCIELAKEKKLILTSCHPRRFDPPFVWLKDHLAYYIGDLGKVISFDFDFSYHEPRLAWKHERGMLMDHISHEIDLLHFVLGNYVNFEATRLVDDFDRYHVAGFRDDGISFSFSGTRRLKTKQYREFVRIRFERGELLLDANKRKVASDIYMAEVIVKDHDKGSIKSFEIYGTNYTERFKLTNDNFGQAILGLADNYLKYEDLIINTELSVIPTHHDTFDAAFNPFD